MNLQHKTHSLAKTFFKLAFFGSILAMAAWGMNAEASPSEYEPAPEQKPTISSVMIKIEENCLNHQRLVLNVTDKQGRTIYYTFLCEFKFMSEQPPKGDK